MGLYTTCLDCSSLADGQFAGMAIMGRENLCCGVMVTEEGKFLYLKDEDGINTIAPLDSDKVWIRLNFDSNVNIFTFIYSTDGKEYLPTRKLLMARFGHWKGARPALFSYNTKTSAGTAYFDDFIYQRDK